MREKLYTKRDVIQGSEEMDFEGKVLVLDSKRLKQFQPKYHKPEFQLWKATGGFGCSPVTRGTAVYCKSLADGEECRMERYEFIGILKETLLEEALTELKQTAEN